MKKAEIKTHTDEEIIQLFCNRDEEALRAVERQYGHYLRTVAERITGDRRDAEECISDVLLKVWNAIPPAHPNSLQGYLAAAIRREAISMNRKNRAEKRGKDVMELPLDEYENVLFCDQDPVEALEQKEVSQIMNSFLNSLPEDQRYCFLGRYYFGRSAKELAKELRVSESKVFRKLAAAKSDLRRQLEKGGFQS